MEEVQVGCQRFELGRWSVTNYFAIDQRHRVVGSTHEEGILHWVQIPVDVTTAGQLCTITDLMM